MEAFLYYLSYPFLILLSRLPFFILHGVSDILYFFVYIVWGYRKAVTTKNLRNAFPEKSEKEIISIRRKFYRFLCDQVILSIKSIAITEKEILKRCTFVNPEVVEEYRDKGRKILFVLGHYGSWEISGPAFGLKFNINLIAAYKPLANKHFEKLITYTRTRFRVKLIPKTELLKYLHDKKDDVTYLVLIADQSPNPKAHYWVQFLNQPTAVVTGMDRIAKQYDFVVIYAGLRTNGRGHYAVRMKLISDNAKEMEPEHITELYMKELEADILYNPVPYLWSHRRWKLTDRLKNNEPLYR